MILLKLPCAEEIEAKDFSECIKQTAFLKDRFCEYLYIKVVQDIVLSKINEYLLRDSPEVGTYALVIVEQKERRRRERTWRVITAACLADKGANQR